MRSLLKLLLFVLLGSLSAAVVAGDPEPLPPQEAFKLAAPVYDGKALVLTYTIAPGYYMYGNRFKFQLEPNVALGVPELPPGHVKDDPYIGKVEIYRDSLTIKVPVLAAIDPSKTIVVARSQGCADVGLCYPPYTWKLPLAATSQVDSTPVPASTGLLNEVVGRKKSSDGLASAADQSTLGQLLKGHSWWLIVPTFIALGLSLSLLACVYPLIPIISGIILVGGSGRRRGFLLSLAYTQGVAITYTIAGIVAGFTGEMLAQTLQKPWVIGMFALVFVALALAMFGLFQLQLPAGLQSKLSDRANRLSGGRFLTVLLMGMVSAVVIGPCMAPPLAAAFLYIAQTGDALAGGIALYALGVGIGLPVLAVGVFGSSLLPHAGPWMNTVRSVFGVVFLGMALWIVQPLLSSGMLMLAWAVLLIGSGVFLHALEPLPVNAHAIRRLAKVAGIVLLLSGAALLIGFLAGNRDVLQPLKGLGASAVAQTNSPIFQSVTTPAALQQNIIAAKGRPVLVDVYADWCIACHELERETFADPSVKSALGQWQTLKLDMTENTPEQRKWLQQHQLFGPPALLLYGRNGQLQRTLVGFQSPEQLLAALKELS